MNLERHPIFITDTQRFSLNDGPGIRTTVFLKGCPLNCFWCHNPETQLSGQELMYFERLCIGCQLCAEACPVNCLTFSPSGQLISRHFDRVACTLCGLCAAACPTDALKVVGRNLFLDEWIGIVRQDRNYLIDSGGGVTFSGGEPLLQVDPLFHFIHAVHAEGIHTAIDTSGSVTYNCFEKILDDTDLFLYDIKSMDSEKHRQATGMDNRQILSNLRKLADNGKALIIRVPVIPGFNDTEADIREIAAFTAALGITRLDLLPFHRYAGSKYAALGREYPASELPDLESSSIENLADVARFHVADVRIESH